MPTFLRPSAGVVFYGSWIPGWSSLALLDPALISMISVGIEITVIQGRMTLPFEKILNFC
jgi:hypothetical protein